MKKKHSNMDNVIVLCLNYWVILIKRFNISGFYIYHIFLCYYRGNQIKVYIL